MKKIKDWLETIEDPKIREAALYNMEHTDYPSLLENTTDLAQAVELAFWWKGSPEGHEYWRTFYNSLVTPDRAI